MLEFAIYAITMTGIWAVLALSLNLQFGLSGLVNFGQVLPFAVGAYGTAICVVHGLPLWLGIAVGTVLAPIVGLLVILPARRLAQDYWALITLGAGEIFRLTMLNFPWIAGGVEGVPVARLGDRMLAMVLALTLLAVAFLVAQRISDAPLGRLLRVMREDETLAATLGRRPFRFQSLITIVAWTMAGIAGVLYAHVTGYVSTAAFMVIETFVVWTAVVLGGPGRNLGVVLGAVVVQLLSLATRFVAEWSALPSELVANLRLGLIGLILVLMFLFRPDGLLPETRARRDAQRV